MHLVIYFPAFSIWLFKKLSKLRTKFKRKTSYAFEQNGRFSRTKSVTERTTSSQNLLPMAKQLHGEKNKTFINESTSTSSSSSLTNDDGSSKVNMSVSNGQSLTHLVPRDFPNFYLFGSANKVLMSKQLKLKMQNGREQQPTVHFSDEIVNKVDYFM